MNVMTVDGIVTIDVERDALVIRSGFPRGQHVATIQRHTADVDHLVIATQHGSITFAASQWLADVGIPWCQIGTEPHDERYANFPVAHSAKRPRYALLKRAQALAQTRPVGVKITRFLLDAKFAGQRDIATQLGSDVDIVIEGHRRALARASLASCRSIESEVARQVYWDAWRTVEMKWEDDVPEFWCRFPSRTSDIAGNSPRNAACPINALLNYGYAVLQAATTVACYSMNLDPLLGILHTDSDTEHRASMSADLMEPGRPLVDRVILNALTDRKFRRDEFVKTRRGIFRLRPDLAHWMSEEVHAIVPDVYPVWETVLSMLVDTQSRDGRTPRTPLTHNNSKRGTKKDG